MALQLTKSPYPHPTTWPLEQYSYASKTGSGIMGWTHFPHRDNLVLVADRSTAQILSLKVMWGVEVLESLNITQLRHEADFQLVARSPCLAVKYVRDGERPPRKFQLWFRGAREFKDVKGLLEGVGCRIGVKDKGRMEEDGQAVGASQQSQVQILHYGLSSIGGLQHQQQQQQQHHQQQSHASRIHQQQQHIPSNAVTFQHQTHQHQHQQLQQQQQQHQSQMAGAAGTYPQPAPTFQSMHDQRLSNHHQITTHQEQQNIPHHLHQIPQHQHYQPYNQHLFSSSPLRSPPGTSYDRPSTSSDYITSPPGTSSGYVPSMIPLPLYGDLDLDEMPPPRTPIALRKPAAKEPFLPLDALTSPITPTGEPIRKKPLPPLESLPPLKKPTPVKRAMVIDVPVEKEITAPQKKPKKKAAPKENAVPKEKSTPKDKAPPKEKAPPKSKATPKSRAVPKKVKEAVSGDAVSEISVPGPGNGTTTTQPVLETVSTAESVSPTTSKNSASESGPSVAGKRSRDELEETLEEKKARYDKRIERMVLEALDDPEFTELCEAVGSVWQRMGLGKELE